MRVGQIRVGDERTEVLAEVQRNPNGAISERASGALGLQPLVRCRYQTNLGRAARGCPHSFDEVEIP